MCLNLFTKYTCLVSFSLVNRNYQKREKFETHHKPENGTDADNGVKENEIQSGARPTKSRNEKIIWFD